MRFLNTLSSPRNIKLKELINKQEEFQELGSEFHLALIFIYGSLADDRLGPLSDVDVAVLSQDLRPLPFKALLNITVELQKIVGREDIDLIDLAKAPPLLSMSVLRHGKVLYSRQEADLTRFGYQTIVHFLDTQPLRDSLSQHLKTVCLGSSA